MAAPLVKTSTPGIFKRGSRYVVVWTHRGRQHKESFGTLAEAREAQGLRRQSGEKRKAPRRHFVEYFEQWITTYAGRTARGFSETTRPEYERPIRAHALPAWRTYRLAEVEPADVRELFAQLREDGASTSAIKKLRAPLSALFATAVEENLVRTNPVAGVRIPSAAATTEPATEERPKALTRAELAVFLDALEAGDRLLFEFLAHTGMRIGEAIGLRWEHLDLGGGQPRVRVREQVYEGVRKTLKTPYSIRDLPLSPAMNRALLARRRDAFTGEHAPVFASAAGTELRPANVYRRVLFPAAKRAGLTAQVEVVEKGQTKTRERSLVSFHTFRHTCASLQFEAGRNVKQVSGWLGHADAGFTLRTYVHLMDEGIGDAAFFDEVVRPAGEAIRETV